MVLLYDVHLKSTFMFEFDEALLALLRNCSCSNQPHALMHLRFTPVSVALICANDYFNSFCYIKSSAARSSLTFRSVYVTDVDIIKTSDAKEHFPVMNKCVFFLQIIFCTIKMDAHIHYNLLVFYCLIISLFTF